MINPSYFINRPVFASVISIVIAAVGLVCLTFLPIEQYPVLAPPMVSVSAAYPGATAQMVADEVGAVLEKQLNGIDNMAYMFSTSTVPGTYSLNIYFDIGADPDKAQTDIQNKVSLMLRSLPQPVQDAGVWVSKQTEGTLLFIAIQAEDELYDERFIGNYANLQVAEALKRLPQVSTARVFNGKDYSIRVWLKTDRMAQLGFSVTDVVEAIQSQTKRGGAGAIGQPPNPPSQQLTIPVEILGTDFKTVAEFEEIILRASSEGAIVRLKNIADIELGSRNYDVIGRLNQKAGTFIGISKEPLANSVEVSNAVRKKMQELSEFFPKGLSYSIPYDTCQYIRISIKEVMYTFFEAALLVTLVIFLFLHSLRATLVPLIALFVSISGTFIGIYFLGFSLNSLTLFGLVLAIGIVVDDAIIVVENVERNIRAGLPPKEAAIKTMEDVTRPIIAIVLVLSSVFIPVAFIGGIPGQFYRQFALAISISVAISGIVALTLSPVLSALLLRPDEGSTSFGKRFDQWFERINERYLAGVKRLFQKTRFGFTLFGLLLVSLFFLIKAIPLGLVPGEDKGYLMVSVQLPDGASLDRSDAVTRKMEEMALQTAGVQNVISFTGQSLLYGIPETFAAASFIQLKDWDVRKTKELSAHAITEELNRKFQEIIEACVVAMEPSSIPGVGTTGGFDLWILNETDATPSEMADLMNQVIAKAKTYPFYKQFIADLQSSSLSLSLDLDRVKAFSLGVAVDEIIQTLQCLFGSVFLTHFYKSGRCFDAVAQATPENRNDVDDIGNVYVRSRTTEKMVPLKSLVLPHFSADLFCIRRFNNSPASHICVIPTGGNPQRILSNLEKISEETLPSGMRVAWGGLAREEKKSGGASGIALIGGLFLVFLVLAALYERWSLPFIILLSFPFAFLGALLAVWLRGIHNDIFCQIGLVTLIGLSAKNAILIVEFARTKKMEGASASEAALQGASMRFRAIIMTSLTLIFGVLPLVFSTGAGAMSRHSVGTGMVGGMFLSTLLGVFFVPFFYRTLEEWRDKRRK